MAFIWFYRCPKDGSTVGQSAPTPQGNPAWDRQPCPYCATPLVRIERAAA